MSTLQLVREPIAEPEIPLARNPGIPLDEGWLNDVRTNRAAIERRTSTLPARRTVKKEWQAAWLLKAISCIDLTTLAGDDTPTNVRRLCAKAANPVRQDILDALYHEMIPYAVQALKGTGIPVAAVSTGFPAGLSPFETRVREIEMSVEAGAEEIDIVISRRHVLAGDWASLYDEVKTFRQACGHAHVKTILATGELGTLKNVARASLVCMMAGADFIKTSTGKEPNNATLPNSLVMARAIRDYHERTGHLVGFKPAGGIKTAKQALDWLILMKEELGNTWLTPHLFRLGASSLLADIERQLEHAVTGRYAAVHHQPMA
jgi:deoxyribose-phosphate aldolase